MKPGCRRAAAALLAAGLGLAAAAPPKPLPPDRYPPEVAALHRRAVAGQAQDRFDLAIVLLCGTQVPRDPGSAAVWLALAAPQPHAGAQSVFGWQLMTATGVLQDDHHAARWLQAAAEAGETAAQNNLGVLYAQGRGVKQDLAQAEHWFREAARKGAEDAAANLDRLLDREPARPRAGAGASKKQASAPPHPALSAAACRARPAARTG